MREKQIVIIDDSQAILMIMRSMLSELGHTNVVTSSSAKSAIKHLKKYPDKYNIVFTDLNMPDTDGMEVIRKLGDMGFNGGVCIISDMDKRVIELSATIARQHNVNLIGNIAKPIHINELKRALNKMTLLNDRIAGHSQSMTRDELQACIDNHHIVPYYQPKVNIQNRKVDGVEVLARIAKPGEVTAILPGQFIPTAVRYGLLNVITHQLFEQACEDLPKLIQEFGPDIKVSINLSPSQLAAPNYPNELEALVKGKHIDRKNITLEITEEFALDSTEQLESLNRFRMRGFGLSLDDFGTGFTNLQQLRSLPFTEVKIDRSLINDIHCDQFNQVVVNSLASISDKLEVALIAEGMETIEDLNYLEKLYSNMQIQGFLICKPKPLDSLMHWYHSWLKV